MIVRSSFDLGTASGIALISLIEGRMQAAFAPQGVLIARLDRAKLSAKGRSRIAWLEGAERSSEGRSRIVRLEGAGQPSDGRCRIACRDCAEPSAKVRRIAWRDRAEPSAKGRFRKRVERTPAPGIAVGTASALRQGHRIVEKRTLCFRNRKKKAKHKKLTSPNRLVMLVVEMRGIEPLTS